jgi:hypothetical protein
MPVILRTPEEIEQWRTAPVAGALDLQRSLSSDWAHDRRSRRERGSTAGSSFRDWEEQSLRKSRTSSVFAVDFSRVIVTETEKYRRSWSGAETRRRALPFALWSVAR